MRMKLGLKFCGLLSAAFALNSITTSVFAQEHASGPVCPPEDNGAALLEEIAPLLTPATNQIDQAPALGVPENPLADLEALAEPEQDVEAILASFPEPKEDPAMALPSGFDLSQLRARQIYRIAQDKFYDGTEEISDETKAIQQDFIEGARSALIASADENDVPLAYNSLTGSRLLEISFDILNSEPEIQVLMAEKPEIFNLEDSSEVTAEDQAKVLEVQKQLSEAIVAAGYQWREGTPVSLSSEELARALLETLALDFFDDEEAKTLFEEVLLKAKNLAAEEPQEGEEAERSENEFQGTPAFGALVSRANSSLSAAGYSTGQVASDRRDSDLREAMNAIEKILREYERWFPQNEESLLPFEELAGRLPTRHDRTFLSELSWTDHESREDLRYLLLVDVLSNLYQKNEEDETNLQRLKAMEQAFATTGEALFMILNEDEIFNDYVPRVFALPESEEGFFTGLGGISRLGDFLEFSAEFETLRSRIRLELEAEGADDPSNSEDSGSVEALSPEEAAAKAAEEFNGKVQARLSEIFDGFRAEMVGGSFKGVALPTLTDLIREQNLNALQSLSFADLDKQDLQSDLISGVTTEDQLRALAWARGIELEDAPNDFELNRDRFDLISHSEFLRRDKLRHGYQFVEVPNHPLPKNFDWTKGEGLTANNKFHWQLAAHVASPEYGGSTNQLSSSAAHLLDYSDEELMMLAYVREIIPHHRGFPLLNTSGEEARNYTRQELEDLVEEVSEFKDLWKSFFRRPPDIQFASLEEFRDYSAQILNRIRPIQALVPGQPLEYLGLGQEEATGVLDFESVRLLRPYDILRPRDDSIGQQSLIERLESQEASPAYQLALQGDRDLVFTAESWALLESDLEALSERLKAKKAQLVQELSSAYQASLEEIREKNQERYADEFVRLREEADQRESAIKQLKIQFDQLRLELESSPTEVLRDRLEQINLQIAEKEYELDLIERYETGIRQGQDEREEIFEAAESLDFNDYTLASLEALDYLTSDDEAGAQRLLWTERFARLRELTQEEIEAGLVAEERLPLFQYLAVTDPRSLRTESVINKTAKDFATRYAMHQRLFANSPRAVLEGTRNDGVLVFLEETQAKRIEIIQALNRYQTYAQSFSSGSRKGDSRTVFFLPAAPDWLRAKTDELTAFLDANGVPADDDHRAALLRDGAEFVVSTRSPQVRAGSHLSLENEVIRDMNQFFDWLGTDFFEGLEQHRDDFEGQNDQFKLFHNEMSSEAAREALIQQWAQQIARASVQEGFDYARFRHDLFRLLNVQAERIDSPSDESLRSEAQRLGSYLNSQVEQAAPLRFKADEGDFSFQDDLASILDYLIDGRRKYEHHYFVVKSLAAAAGYEKSVIRKQDDILEILEGSSALAELREETEGLSDVRRQRETLIQARGDQIRNREALQERIQKLQWTGREIEQVFQAEFRQSDASYEIMDLPEQSIRTRTRADTTAGRLATLSSNEQAGIQQSIESAQSIMGGVLRTRMLSHSAIVRDLFLNYSSLPADEADRVKKVEAWIQTRSGDYRIPMLRMLGLLPPDDRAGLPREQIATMEAYEDDFLDRLNSKEWKKESDILKALSENYFKAGQSLLKNEGRPGLTRGMIRLVIELTQMDPEFRELLIIPADDGLFNSGDLVSNEEAEQIMDYIAHSFRINAWSNLWANGSKKDRKAYKQDLSDLRRMLSSLHVLFTPADGFQSTHAAVLSQVAAPSAMRHLMTQAGRPVAAAYERASASRPEGAKIPSERVRFIQQKFGFASDFLGLPEEKKAEVIQLSRSLSEARLGTWTQVLSQTRDLLEAIERDNRSAASQFHRGATTNPRSGRTYSNAMSRSLPSRVNNAAQGLKSRLRGGGLSVEDADALVGLLVGGSFRKRSSVPTKKTYDETAELRDQWLENISPEDSDLMSDYSSWRVGDLARGDWTVRDVLSSRYSYFYDLIEALNPEEAKKIENPDHFIEPLARAFEAGEIDINRIFEVVHRANIIDIQEAQVLALLQGDQLQEDERLSAAYWMLENIERVSIAVGRSIVVDDYLQQILDESGELVPALRESKRESFKSLVREFYSLERELYLNELSEIIPNELCEELNQLALFCRQKGKNFYVDGVAALNAERKNLLEGQELSELTTKRDELFAVLGWRMSREEFEQTAQLANFFGESLPTDLDSYEEMALSRLESEKRALTNRLQVVSESESESIDDEAEPSESAERVSLTQRLEAIDELIPLVRQLESVEALAKRLSELQRNESRVFTRQIQAEQSQADLMAGIQVAGWVEAELDQFLRPWHLDHEGFDPPYRNHFYTAELERNLQRVRDENIEDPLLERELVLGAIQAARATALTRFLDDLVQEQGSFDGEDRLYEDYHLILRDLYGLDFSGFLSEISQKDPQKRENVVRGAVELAAARQHLLTLNETGAEGLMSFEELEAYRSVIQPLVFSLAGQPDQPTEELPRLAELDAFDTWEAGEDRALVLIARQAGAEEAGTSSVLSSLERAGIVTEQFKLFKRMRGDGEEVNWQEASLLRDDFDESPEAIVQLLKDFNFRDDAEHSFGLDFESASVVDEKTFAQTLSDLKSVRETIVESIKRSQNPHYREQVASLYDVLRLGAIQFGQMAVYSQELSTSSQTFDSARLMRKALSDLYDAKEANGYTDEQILGAMDKFQASQVEFLNANFEKLYADLAKKDRVWWQRWGIGTAQAIGHFAVGTVEAVAETGYWVFETVPILWTYYGGHVFGSHQAFDDFVAWSGGWEHGEVHNKQDLSLLSRRRYSGWTLDKVQDDGFGSWLGHQVINAASVAFIAAKALKPAQAAARGAVAGGAEVAGRAATSGAKGLIDDAGKAIAQSADDVGEEVGRELARSTAADGAGKIVLTAEEAARQGVRQSLRQRAGSLSRSVLDASKKPIYIFGRPHRTAENQTHQALGFMQRLFKGTDPEQAARTGWRRWFAQPAKNTGKFVLTGAVHTGALLGMTTIPTLAVMSPEQRSMFLSNFGDHMGETTGLILALMLFHGRLGRFAIGGDSRLRQAAGLANSGVSTSFQYYILREAGRASVVYAESEFGGPIYEKGDFTHDELLETLSSDFDESKLTPEMSEAREKLRKYYEQRANFVGQAFLVGYLTTSSNFPQFYQGLINRAGGGVGRVYDGAGRVMDRARGAQPTRRGESFGKMGEFIYPVSPRIVEEDLLAFLRTMRGEQLQAAARSVQSQGGLVSKAEIRAIYERSNNTLVAYRDYLLNQGGIERLMRASGSPMIRAALRDGNINLGTAKAETQVREMVRRVFDRVLNETELENFNLRIQSVTETPGGMSTTALQALFHQANGDLPGFIRTARERFGSREQRNFDEMSFAEKRLELQRLQSMADQVNAEGHIGFFASGRPTRAWEQGMRRRLRDREEGRQVERENLPEFATDLFANVRSFDHFIARIFETPIHQRPHHGSILEGLNGQRTELSAMKRGVIGAGSPPGDLNPMNVWTRYDLFSNGAQGRYMGHEWIQVGGTARRIEMNQLSAEFRFSAENIQHMSLGNGSIEFQVNLPASRTLPNGERVEIRVDKLPGRFDGEVTIRRQDGLETRYSNIAQAKDVLKREFGIQVRGANASNEIPTIQNPLVTREEQSVTNARAEVKPNRILNPKMGDGVLEYNYRVKWRHMGRDIESWARAELFGEGTMLFTYPNGAQKTMFQIRFETRPEEVTRRSAEVANERGNQQRLVEGQSAQDTMTPRTVEGLARQSRDLAMPESRMTEFEASFPLVAAKKGEYRFVDPITGEMRMMDTNGFLTVANPRSQYIDFFYAAHPSQQAAFSFRVTWPQYIRIAERAFELGVTPSELIYMNSTGTYWREMGRVFDENPSDVTVNVKNPDARVLNDYMAELRIQPGTGFEARSAENQLRILRGNRDQLLRELDREMGTTGDVITEFRQREILRQRFYVEEAFYNLEAYIKHRSTLRRPGEWPRPTGD